MLVDIIIIIIIITYKFINNIADNYNVTREDGTAQLVNGNNRSVNYCERMTYIDNSVIYYYSDGSNVNNGSDGHNVNNGSDGHDVNNGSDGHDVNNGSDGHNVNNGSDGHNVNNGSANGYVIEPRSYELLLHKNIIIFIKAK